MLNAPIEPLADEQFWFNQFRIGLWPEYCNRPIGLAVTHKFGATN